MAIMVFEISFLASQLQMWNILYFMYNLFLNMLCIVMDLINALPGNSSVITVQHAKIEEAVFSVDLTYVPIDWLDSDHVIYK
jgi:hypothetical protein